MEISLTVFIFEFTPGVMGTTKLMEGLADDGYGVLTYLNILYSLKAMLAREYIKSISPSFAQSIAIKKIMLL